MLQMSPYPENPSRSGAVRASHELGRAIWAGADDLIQVSWLLSALLSSVSIADRQHTTTVMPFPARASAMLSQLIFAVYCADPTAADGDRDAGKRRRAAADAAVRLTTYTAATPRCASTPPASTPAHTHMPTSIEARELKTSS